MADNIEIVTAGGETVTLRTVEIAGVHYPVYATPWLPPVTVLNNVSVPYVDYTDYHTEGFDVTSYVHVTPAIEFPVPGFNATMVIDIDWGPDIGGEDTDNPGNYVFSGFYFYWQYSLDGTTWSPYKGNSPGIFGLAVTDLNKVDWGSWMAGDATSVDDVVTPYETPGPYYDGVNGTVRYARLSYWAEPGFGVSGNLTVSVTVFPGQQLGN